MPIRAFPPMASMPEMHKETVDKMDEILRVLSSIQVTLGLLLVLGRGDDLSEVSAILETLQNRVGDHIGKEGEVSDLPLALPPSQTAESLAGLAAFVAQFREDDIEHDDRL